MNWPLILVIIFIASWIFPTKQSKKLLYSKSHDHYVNKKFLKSYIAKMRDKYQPNLNPISKWFVTRFYCTLLNIFWTLIKFIFLLIILLLLESFYQTTCAEHNDFLLHRCHLRYLFESNCLPKVTLDIIQASHDPLILNIIDQKFNHTLNIDWYEFKLPKRPSLNEMRRIHDSLQENPHLIYSYDKLKTQMLIDANLQNRVIDIVFRMNG